MRKKSVSSSSPSPLQPPLVWMQWVYHFDGKLVNSITYTVGIGRIYDCNVNWNQEKWKLCRECDQYTHKYTHSLLHIAAQLVPNTRKYSSNFNILKRFGLVSTEHTDRFFFSSDLFWSIFRFSFPSFQSELYFIHLFWFFCFVTFLALTFPYFIASAFILHSSVDTWKEKKNI